MFEYFLSLIHNDLSFDNVYIYSYFRAKTFGANLPAVILSKHDDNIQPHVVFNQKYTIQNLEQFVNDNKLPKVVRSGFCVLF